MLQGYARFISKFRWVVLTFWLVVTAASMVWLPNLTTVVAHQSTNFLPNSSPVMQAGKLLSQIQPGQSAKSTAVVAIHDANGLKPAEITYFHQTLAGIAQKSQHYGVKSVQDAANVDASASSSFRSSDGTTEIALVGFPTDDISTQTAAALQKLHQAFASPPGQAHVYFTGDAPIQQDDNTISQNGVQKTAGITVALVLIILLIVFRSVIAPLVTLLAIGLSFLISTSLVAWLAGFGMPISNFTETFMVAVLFGAGTDYSIIILNRYREEMGKGHDHLTTLTNTIRAISKTMVFSSLTVLVSFAVLYFAHFGLYRSAVGVSVGVFITLLVCLTFVPALMDTLGRFLYWPRKLQIGAAHRPSKLWSATARWSTRRPWWTLLALTAVLAPIALLFTNQRTFNPMDDIPGAPSVSGFRVVSNAFGPGNVLPMNLVLHTPANLRTPQGLATIDAVTKAVAALPYVSKVESVTQPTGSAITSFQLANQNVQAATGLGQVQSGLSQLATQLTKASQSVKSAATSGKQLVAGAQQVASGATAIHQAITKAADGSSQVVSGANQLTSGSQSLGQGLQQFSQSAGQVSTGAGKLSQGLTQAASASKSVATGAAQVSTGSQQLSQVASQLSNAIAAWTAAHPGLSADPSWQQIQQLAGATTQAATATSQGATQVNGGAQSLANAFPGLLQGAGQVASGSQGLATGANSLSAGAGKLSTGANALAGGAQSLQQGLTRLNGGSASLATGSSQVAQGVGQVQTGLSALASGVGQAATASQKLSNGVSQVQQALVNSKQASKTGDPGFYLPSSALSNSSLQKAMDAYISPSGHVANFTVVLKDNPYSLTALNHVSNMEHTAQAALATSPLPTGTIQSAGATAVQAELNQVSTSDFVRTVAFIMVAIFILLVLMLRSIVTPLYILASLSATYLVTMGILQTIAVHVMHKPGLSWPVPFFVFLLLVALGVDYSIFLFSRFDEELASGHAPRVAIQRAMGQMGNVIFSAALIMGGTFGSMTVAGVTSLMEIGLAVVIGLFLYAAVLLGFFVPACASVLGMGHFWPFRREVVSESTTATRVRQIPDTQV